MHFGHHMLDWCFNHAGTSGHITPTLPGPGDGQAALVRAVGGRLWCGLCVPGVIDHVSSTTCFLTAIGRSTSGAVWTRQQYPWRAPSVPRRGVIQVCVVHIE